MSFKPLMDRVLAELVEDERKTESGIIIPDTAKKEKPQKGKVVSVGKDVKLVQEGDEILFAKYSGNELKFDNKNYIVLKEEDILGKFE